MVDQLKQMVGSFSQSPTVTGDTLNPLSFILRIWATNLSTMLRMSLVPSMATFHSLQLSTDVRIHTFWSCTSALLISAHMQVSPPITLTSFTRGSNLQRSLQEMKVPQPVPRRPPKPTSRQVRSQLDRMTWFFRPASLSTFLATPHQWMTSSASRGRSMSSLAQQMAFLKALMFLHRAFCLLRQQMESCWQVVMLCSSIHFFIDGFREQQLSTISSPPKWAQLSTKVLFTSAITSFTTQQVRSRVGSNWPWYSLLQRTTMSLSLSDRPQLSVWAGVSNSGITLTPLILAQLMMDLTSAREQMPENLPQSASSGQLSTTRGKLSSSVMCQCSTLILLQSRASMVCLMASTDRKCRDESIMSPLHTQLGVSSMVMGLPLMQYLLFFLSNSWEKVSSPRRKPTQQSATSSHFSEVRMVSWQVSWLGCSATIWLGFLTTMLSLVAPGFSSRHLNTSIRYRFSICFTQSEGLASITQFIVHGSTSVSSAVSLRLIFEGSGHSSLVLLAAAAGRGLVAGPRQQHRRRPASNRMAV